MEATATDRDDVAVLFGAALAFVVHVSMIALVLVADAFGDDAASEVHHVPVLSTELLMFGDVMPEDGQLPWIANPEEAPLQDDAPEPPPVPEQRTTLPQQETVVLEATDPPEEVPEENRARPEERDPERVERRNRGETNPNRPTNPRPRMGSTQGIEGGTSLSAEAMANQFSGLVRQLGRALRRPSAIPDSEYRRLVARVEIRTTVQGRITHWDFVDPSGNRLFDAAVSSMLNRFRMGSDRLRLQTVSDDALRARMIGEGFRIPIRGQ